MKHRRIGTDIRFDLHEIIDATHGDNARIVRVIFDLELQPHGALRVAQEEDVAVDKRDLATTALRRIEHLARAQHTRAVRALQVTNHVAVA